MRNVGCRHIPLEGMDDACLCHVRRSVFDRVLDLLVAMLCCNVVGGLSTFLGQAFLVLRDVFWGAALMCREGWGGKAPPKWGAKGAKKNPPRKISPTFTFTWWSKSPKFGHIRHGPLVNTSHSKCSSVTIYIQNLTKLQDPMSHTLSHTFHSKIQPYNYLTKNMASICTKQHYLCQALYFMRTQPALFVCCKNVL